MVTMIEKPIIAGLDSAIRTIALSKVSNVQSATVTGIPSLFQLAGQVCNPERWKQLFNRVPGSEIWIDKGDPGAGRTHKQIPVLTSMQDLYLREFL